MTALADAYALLKTGTLWHNTQLASPKHPCKGYADANPGEAAQIDSYVAALAAGQSAAPPVLATATGRGLVGMLAALAPTAPPPATSGELVEFGNFAAGDLSEFSDPSGGNYGPSTGRTTVQAGGPNGGNYARLTADEKSILYGDTRNARVHLIGFKAGRKPWYNNGGRAAFGISMRVPSGFTHTDNVYAGPESHGDNGTGPAPFNISFRRGGNWTVIVRGGTSTTGVFAKQWAFGTPGTPDSQHAYQDWAGGNKIVTLDEWLHLRFQFGFSPTDGSVAVWARWQGLNDWRNIVPLKTGVPTCYPDANGDGWSLSPFLSLYYSMAPGTEAVDYAAGAWSDDLATLSAWQDRRLGFAA